MIIRVGPLYRMMSLFAATAFAVAWPTAWGFAQSSRFVVADTASGGYLNMRSGPGQGHRVIAQLPVGSTGVLSGECRAADDSRSRYEWCQAEWQGYSGWVSTCCIIRGAAGSDEVASVEEGKSDPLRTRAPILYAYCFARNDPAKEVHISTVFELTEDQCVKIEDYGTGVTSACLSLEPTQWTLNTLDAAFNAWARKLNSEWWGQCQLFEERQRAQASLNWTRNYFTKKFGFRRYDRYLLILTQLSLRSYKKCSCGDE